MSTKSLPPRYFLTQRNSNFTIKDYWKEQKEYWYPLLIEGKKASYKDIFKHHIDKKIPYDSSLIKDEDDHEGMWQARKKHVCNYLNIKEDKIEIFDHHNCHGLWILYIAFI